MVSQNIIGALTFRDANQNVPDDSYMRFAAAANALDWSDRGAPGYNSPDAIFQYLEDHWTNDPKGGVLGNSLTW